MLRTQFNDALKTALLGKDERTVATVRLILAKLKDFDIAARPTGNTEGISDEAICSMMQGMIKQRRESIALYEKGNRPDLVKQESEEITVIERFLPKQMGEDEIKAAITKAIAAIGAKDIKDMGKVMGEMKKTYAGQMDFGIASNLIKNILSGGT
ncbi:MAG: GatB/YqeY domain-containing protein [Alphaproteobacteria bacterium]|nr:GatB/YqeY domain-containing protein [Alphaproteobacteria bacterium]